MYVDPQSAVNFSEGTHREVFLKASKCFINSPCLQDPFPEILIPAYAASGDLLATFFKAGLEIARPKAEIVAGPFCFSLEKP